VDDREHPHRRRLALLDQDRHRRRLLELEQLRLARPRLDVFEIDRDGWRAALATQQEFFDSFGERLPDELRDEQQALAGRLGQA
jgi:GTP-dependent phosphoenolpyruvate carboxykinase